jgi:hypothetical protein
MEYEFVEYVVSSISDGSAEESVRLFMDGFQTFIVPIAWTFSEAFDSTVYAIGEFLGISE